MPGRGHAGLSRTGGGSNLGLRHKRVETKDRDIHAKYDIYKERSVMR